MTQREIKFRAWDKENQNFIYFDLSQNPIYWADKLKDFPIQQSVGLQDKNGKEIYEGDIVRNIIETDSFTNEIEPLITHELLIVKWNNGAYFIENGDLLSEYDDIEIIGNIYENPELLTTNNK